MKNTVSLANLEQIEKLVSLLDLLFSQDIEFESNYEKQKKGLESIIKNPEVGEILVLKIDETIIGMVSLLYSISTALGGKVAVLEDMIIDKDYRKKNYGTTLLNEAIRHAKNKNCLRITLLTDYNNENAITFYHKNGFSKSSMIPMRMIL